jgi:hypothetical protein
MKNALILIVLIYSCTPAKIATISSESVPLKNSTFVSENDMVKITYHFWRDNGIMDFDIYNKTNDPLYFDWKNSAFIPNDQMVSYWQDVTNTIGASSASSLWLYGGVPTSSRSASKSVHQERIAVIPPHSLITKEDFKLVKSYSELPKAGNYNETNSFLNFRNYLMFSTNEKFEGKPLTIDNKFYVSNIKMIKYKKRENYKAENSFVVKMSPSYVTKKNVRNK